MSGKFSALKNVAWAIAIAICLIALLVGLVISMTRGYYGESKRGGVALGASKAAAKDDGNTTDNVTYTMGDGILKLVPETEDGGQDYLNKLTFLCDSTLVGLRDYGMLAGGKDTMQIWATSSGSLPFSTINEATIEYPADGSAQTIEAALKLATPEILVVALGSDGLSALDQAGFLATYRTLVRSIQSASPNTIIVCCGTCSVIENYTGSDGLTPNLMSDANAWIQQVCTESGAYYADIGYPLGDGAGSIFSKYASSNGKTLNTTGLGLVLEYLRNHAVTTP